MMNEPDVASAHELSAGRTIFVDNSGLSSMDFDLTTRQQEELFLNGVRAATEFVIEAARRGGVPGAEVGGGPVLLVRDARCGVALVRRVRERVSPNCQTRDVRVRRGIEGAMQRVVTGERRRWRR